MTRRHAIFITPFSIQSPIDGYELQDGAVLTFSERISDGSRMVSTAYIVADTPEAYEAGDMVAKFLKSTFDVSLSDIDHIIIYEDGRGLKVVKALERLSREKVLVICRSEFNPEIMSRVLELYAKGERINLPLLRRVS